VGVKLVAELFQLILQLEPKWQRRHNIQICIALLMSIVTSHVPGLHNNFLFGHN
jgi:hypothetical protein